LNKHQPSQDTYDYIGKWITPKFFFSENDKWDRMGMLGVFGDYVLSCTQGDVFEIGVGESSIYLTEIAKKYERRIFHCDIEGGKIINPMSIPGYLSDDLEFIDDSPAVEKYEPRKRAVAFRGASDDFFRKITLPLIALGFIDGDHSYEQVRKDFFNLLPYVNTNGYIFLHDTYPIDEEWIDLNHCGTVYKLRQEIEKLPGLQCLTLVRGTAMGVGMTICRKKPENLKYYNE
jgi:hypothetical protein